MPDQPERERRGEGGERPRPLRRAKGGVPSAAPALGCQARSNREWWWGPTSSKERQEGQGGAGGHGEDSPRSQTPPRRKPYRTLRLVAYGNLRDITMVKGGLQQDGSPAKPFTKV